LQKFAYHYNTRNYLFYFRAVHIWNSLPDYTVEADSVSTFNRQLDKYLINQDVVF